MSESGFERPSQPADDWPSRQFRQNPAYPSPDDGAAGSGSNAYPGWQYPDPATVHGNSDLWAYAQDATSPAGWPADGMYVPQPDAGQHGPHRGPRRFPWRLLHIILLVLATIAGVIVVISPGIVTGGQPSSLGQKPAITLAQAKGVVANYFKVNNEANQARSDALLATIEGGTSYPMDAGVFQIDRASSPSGSDIPPVYSTHTSYYIPRQPASAAYPHWFAAEVTVAPVASPQDPDGTAYLVFSQPSPGASWKDVAEPAIVTSGPAPQIATDAQGYATQVSGTAGLSTAPGAISQLTTSALDAPGTAALKVPGSLADQQDEATLRSQFPAGTTVTDTHQATAGPVYGLRTKDGGAIVFYSVAARVTVVPPPGQMLQMDVPGFYSPSQVLNSADLGYVEQFAAYVPPAGRGGWQIVAAVSNIASQG